MSNQSNADQSDPLCLVFIPPLVVILHHLETKKGLPLSEAEVIDARDKAVCMTMRFSHAMELEGRRGYADIAPEEVWREWQDARKRMINE